MYFPAPCPHDLHGAGDIIWMLLYLWRLELRSLHGRPFLVMLEWLPGNPGTPQDARKSTNRNVRLYHCIANYIDRDCSIYRDAQMLFPDDGRALFNYIWHKGERAFTA